MNNSICKFFYLLNGDWHKFFNDFEGTIQINKHQSLEIWEPRDKNKHHNLIIVYWEALPERYCFENNIWKMDENIFVDFYEDREEQFEIHVSNKFEQASSFQTAGPAVNCTTA